MDISMPGISRFQAARTLLERTPEFRIIFASEHADPLYAEAALRLGKEGYVINSAAGTELLPAIHQLA